MKLKALLFALIAALVLASGAAAKNGGGSGKGPAQTKHPASAGAKHSFQGSKHEAKSHKAKTPKSKVKKPKQHDTAVAEDAGDNPATGETDYSAESDAEGKNPAWTCRARLEERGSEQFVSDYGTNTNGANAFGKCVSSVAHGDVEETAEVPSEPTDECEAVASGAIGSTEVEIPDDQESPGESEDAPCEPADEDETTTTPPGGGTADTTTGTLTGPAVPGSDEALLAALEAVKALAATL